MNIETKLETYSWYSKIMKAKLNIRQRVGNEVIRYKSPDNHIRIYSIYKFLTRRYKSTKNRENKSEDPRKRYIDDLNCNFEHYVDS